MKTEGIRIFDKKNGVIHVTLAEILEEVLDGSSLHWSILFLDGVGHLDKEKSLPDFEQLINKSKNGLVIQWEDLNVLSRKFHQIIDMVLIGCRDESLLSRYENDQEMYETCDIVIVMFDSWFWEIFSKNNKLIDKFTTRFKEMKIEYLDSDFQKHGKPKSM